VKRKIFHLLLQGIGARGHFMTMDTPKYFNRAFCSLAVITANSSGLGLLLFYFSFVVIGFFHFVSGFNRAPQL